MVGEGWFGRETIGAPYKVLLLRLQIDLQATSSSARRTVLEGFCSHVLVNVGRSGSKSGISD